MRIISRNSFGKAKFLAMLLASSLLLWGCDSTSPQNENNRSQLRQDVQNFRSTYSASLNHVGDYLGKRGTSLSNRSAVKAGMQDFLQERSGTGSEAYENATDAFERYYQQASGLKTGTLSSKSNSSERLPENVREVVRNAQNALQKSESYAAYKEHLREAQQAVLNEDWSRGQKEQALTYLVVMEETMGFLKSNQHLAKQASGAAVTADGQLVAASEEGWWDSWGRCAAGTLGGMGTGALVGAAAGTTIPEPMTTGAGAVIGGISGGLTGAAAAC